MCVEVSERSLEAILRPVDLGDFLMIPNMDEVESDSYKGGSPGPFSLPYHPLIPNKQAKRREGDEMNNSSSGASC